MLLDSGLQELIIHPRRSGRSKAWPGARKYHNIVRRQAKKQLAVLRSRHVLRQSAIVREASPRQHTQQRLLRDERGPGKAHAPNSGAWPQVHVTEVKPVRASQRFRVVATHKIADLVQAHASS
jgi:hypothetical protein